MLSCGCTPNEATYRIILGYLCKKGELKKGLEVLEEMFKRGFMPHFRTSNALLDGLANAGRLYDLTETLTSLVDGFRSC
ncbi:hypothetical protein SUGI_0815620 [Cryptomeria japonica]|nr:hypothetical protein SUGI_0815620 [Cryptomeria japonica]